MVAMPSKPQNQTINPGLENLTEKQRRIVQHFLNKLALAKQPIHPYVQQLFVIIMDRGDANHGLVYMYTRITNMSPRLAWRIAKWFEKDGKLDSADAFLANFLMYTNGWADEKLMSLQEMDQFMECLFLHERIRSQCEVGQDPMVG